MSTGSLSIPAADRPTGLAAAARAHRFVRRPELIGLLALAGVLNLWGLSINGWANTYYSAAVRSMAASWHNFLFAAMDPSGLMTVDKPPLALWVQALSVRIFGYHPLSVLVPQALMGVAAVALVLDLVARRFGRIAGFVAGFALATTPVIVAVSRHNNPDELLTLCVVAAVWCAVRALETDRTKWLVLSGVAVGLGFETKMLVADMVVPAIAVAWLWSAGVERGWWRSLRQLAAGGAAMSAVSLAWPLLVTLTPAADRPWISGTSDNTVWSLIFGYNGINRVAGQVGGPGGGGPGGGGPGGGQNLMFGGSTGPFRLVGQALGNQAGWLIGFALAAALGVLIATRLRRRDPRTGWLIAVGGSFSTIGVVFSFASGIFHPYYVAELAPFTAALIGAGVGEMLGGSRLARLLAPAALIAGAITELVVLGEIGGQMSWVIPLVVALAGAAAVTLLAGRRVSPRARLAVLAVGLAALFAAPTTWAAETLGHATSSTFPSGGPASVAAGVGGPPGFVRGHFARFGGGFPFGGPPAGVFPGGGAPPGGGASPGGGAFPGGGASPGGGAPPRGGFGGRAMFGSGADLAAAVRYAERHGGGTIGVESQSSAASLIVSEHANVAGLGGFSGRESSVSAAWLAQEVASSHLRWVLVESTGAGVRLPGDTRTGSLTAFDAVAETCRKVTLTSGGTTVTLYDCQGRASALAAAGG